MLRRPVFWIVFTALSIAAAIFTFKNFSTAFPLVSINLKMDRPDALRLARSLAANGVPHSAHVFAHGPHSLGLARGSGETALWTTLAASWIAEQSHVVGVTRPRDVDEPARGHRA